MASKTYQKYFDIDISAIKTKTFYTNITNYVQNAITESDFQTGIVLIHTLHTTTALSFTGFLVQEDEPLLMEDLSFLLDAGAKKILRLLPCIPKNKKNFTDLLPEKNLDDALELIKSSLEPANGYKHDNFEIRVANMGPNERKNAEAHLKALMLKESIAWTFSRGRLNLGIWQNILFWDFDPIGRKKRTLSIIVIGE